MPGTLIKKIREERNITQKEMANMLFMSQSNYSKIENNKVGLTAKVSKRIVSILKVNLEDIIPEDAILESPLLRETIDMEKGMARIDVLLTKKMDELKIWIEWRLSNNNNTSGKDVYRNGATAE